MYKENSTSSNDDKSKTSGRIQQKQGSRLEKAVYRTMPSYMKENITLNHIHRDTSGDAIVEYDMIYSNGDFVISFEIKGINQKICENKERQNKIISQAIKQHNFMKSLNEKNQTVICIVTGNSTINNDIQVQLENNDIIVAVGRFPKNVVNDALEKLHNMNLI